IGVYDPNNEPRLVTFSPTASAALHSNELSRGMALAAQRTAARMPDELEMSNPIALDSGESLRVFGLRLPDHTDGSAAGTIVMVVDTQRLFSKMALLVADKNVHVLLLGPRGRPVPVSDERLISLVTSGDPPPALEQILERARSGDSGTGFIESADSAPLGFEEGDLIAAWAPVHTSVGRWSLATFTSTDGLRA